MLLKLCKGTGLAYHRFTRRCIIGIILLILPLAHESPRGVVGQRGKGGNRGSHGYVHVKVFRGPTQGRPGQEFASWGYHAYLPPDAHFRHYR